MIQRFCWIKICLHRLQFFINHAINEVIGFPARGLFCLSAKQAIGSGGAAFPCAVKIPSPPGWGNLAWCFPVVRLGAGRPDHLKVYQKRRRRRAERPAKIVCFLRRRGYNRGKNTAIRWCMENLNEWKTLLHAPVKNGAIFGWFLEVHAAGLTKGKPGRACSLTTE